MYRMCMYVCTYSRAGAAGSAVQCRTGWDDGAYPLPPSYPVLFLGVCLGFGCPIVSSCAAHVCGVCFLLFGFSCWPDDAALDGDEGCKSVIVEVVKEANVGTSCRMPPLRSRLDHDRAELGKSPPFQEEVTSSVSLFFVPTIVQSKADRKVQSGPWQRNMQCTRQASSCSNIPPGFLHTVVSYQDQSSDGRPDVGLHVCMKGIHAVIARVCPNLHLQLALGSGSGSGSAEC